MITNNSVITAPIGIAEVESVIGTAGHDLGTLCKKSSINVWARYKPSNGGCIVNRKKADGTKEYYSVVYGIAEYSGTQIVGRPNIFKKVTTSNFSNYLTWNLKLPTLNYYRLQDFNGYMHNAKFGFDNSDYKYFPEVTYGKQTGPFYNMYYPILELRSSRPSGLTFEPIQCWEEATTQSLNSYGTLYLEDLIYASEHENIATFKVSSFKLGLAIIKGSTNFVFNTGITLGTIFANSSSNIVDLDITQGETPVHIGSMALQNGGGYVSMNINFESFNTILGLNIFNNDTVTVNVRVVMIDTNDAICVYNTFPSGVNVYAFEPINGFCSKQVTLKKIYTFVNVTSFTNRTDNTARNAGKFFSSTVEESTQTVDYTYNNNNGNWELNSGKSAKPMNDDTGGRDDGMCSFLLDQNNKWRLSNGVFVSDNTSGNYYRFRLRLKGFVCCEFRAKDSTSVTNNYLFPQDVNVVKSVKLKLIQTNPSFGDIHIKVGSDSQYVIPTYSPSTHTGGIEIGYFANSPFLWNKTNVVQVSHLRYCDKQYGNNNDYVNRCYSAMGNLDFVKTGDNSGTSTNTEIYIFVQRTALASKRPNDFYMEILYEFGPDEHGNYEYINVSDQWGDTQITGDLNYWPSYS